MNSMTGFGYAEGGDDGVRVSAEIKSLNARYLDLIVSLPPSLSSLEGRIRECLQDRFLRGRLEVTVRVRDIEESLTVTVNAAAARKWKSALEDLAAVLDGEERVTLDMLIRQEGVLQTEREGDPEAYWAVLDPLLSAAADQVCRDREREGTELNRDIAGLLHGIEEALAAVAQRVPKIKIEVEETLRSRFREIMGNEADEQRILTETAAWIVKTDINEEIVRLRTHIAAFREDAAKGGAKGKRLDFLAQEMIREINTIGSKSPRADVSRRVVDMKDALESLREQLRNVE